MSEKKATRRGFLGVVATAVVVGVVAGVGGYYAGLSTKPPETTTTVTTTQTRTVGTGEMVTTTVTPPPVTTTVTPPPVTTTRTITETPTTTTPSPGEEIHLGGIFNLTGAISAADFVLPWGAERAIRDINKLGGVNVGGRKLPIRLTVYDCASDPTKAGSLASMAILSDKVDGLFSGSGFPVTVNPISVQADRYKTPFLMGPPVEPWMAAGPFKYAWGAMFRIATPIPEGDPRAGKKGYTMVDINFGYTDQFRDQTNEKVALITSDDADGRGWYALFGPALAEHGYEPVGVDKNLGLYPPGTTDFTGMIREWRDNNCEIMWGNLPGPDFATAWRQCAEMGYRPKMCIADRAVMTYEDVMAIGGDLPVGVGNEFFWHPSYPFPGIGDTTCQSLADDYVMESGAPQYNAFIAQSYRDIQIYKDAIERAGTLDKEEVNKAIGETDFMSIVGRIKYVPGENFSPQPLTFGQWLKTEKGLTREIVYSDHPDLKITHEPLFPLPPL